MENDEGLSESQKNTLSAILDSHTKDSECGAPSHLNAAHLLVSAMEGKEAGSELKQSPLTILNSRFIFLLLNLLFFMLFLFVELPDETQRLLGESCPEFLEALDTLVGLCTFLP